MAQNLKFVKYTLLQKKRTTYMYLLWSKIWIGDSYDICGYIALKFCMLLSNTEQPFSKILDFLRILFSEMVKKRIFTPKHKFSQKNKKNSA